MSIWHQESTGPLISYSQTRPRRDLLCYSKCGPGTYMQPWRLLGELQALEPHPALSLNLRFMRTLSWLLWTTLTNPEAIEIKAKVQVKNQTVLNGLKIKSSGTWDILSAKNLNSFLLACFVVWIPQFFLQSVGLALCERVPWEDVESQGSIYICPELCTWVWAMCWAIS